MTIQRIRPQDTFLDRQRETLKDVLNAAPSPRSLRAFRSAAALYEVAMESVLDRNKVDEQTARAQEAQIVASVKAAEERARAAAQAKAQKEAEDKAAAAETTDAPAAG